MALQSDGSILLSGDPNETLVELSSTGVSQAVKVGTIIASAPSGLFQSNGARMRCSGSMKEMASADQG
jgi:hypothetical protein